MKSTGGFMICEDFRTFRNGWHVQYVRSARAHKNNLPSKLRPNIFCFACCISTDQIPLYSVVQHKNNATLRFKSVRAHSRPRKKNLRPQKKNADARARAKKSPTDVASVVASTLYSKAPFPLYVPVSESPP